MLNSPIPLDKTLSAIKNTITELKDKEGKSMLPLYNLLSSYAGREIIGSSDTKHFLSRIYGTTLFVKDRVEDIDRLNSFYDNIASLLDLYLYSLREDGTVMPGVLYFQEELAKIINKTLDANIDSNEALNQMIRAVNNARDRNYIDF